MTQEELKEFLKKNLRIETEVDDCWEAKEVRVRLYLEDEIISTDFFIIHYLN